MRRGKPLGLSIALVLSALLYGLMPLAEAIFFLVLRMRTHRELEPRAWLLLVSGIIFLILMIPAWLGRPPKIRPVLSMAVVGFSVLRLVFVIIELSNRPENGPIQDSGTAPSNASNLSLLLIYVLVPLYIVWYLNRHPSRAYYAQSLDSGSQDE